MLRPSFSAIQAWNNSCPRDLQRTSDFAIRTWRLFVGRSLSRRSRPLQRWRRRHVINRPGARQRQRTGWSIGELHYYVTVIACLRADVRFIEHTPGESKLETLHDLSGERLHLQPINIS